MSTLEQTSPVAATADGAAGACLLCCRNEGGVVWKEHGYEVKYCGPCGVVYLDPAPPPEQVDHTHEQHEEAYYRRPAKIRADWLAQVRPSGRILEVGCGAGHFLIECRKRGYQVYGCEPDAQRAEFCRQTQGLDVEAACIEDSVLPEGSFDIVFHVDLISHFPDPVLALRKMARLLKPGGILCFEAGVLGGVSQRWYRWNGGLACPEHRWFYSLDGVKNLLNRADLSIEKLDQFCLIPSMMPLVLGRTFVKPIVQSLRGKDARPWDGAVDESSGSLRRVHGIYRLGSWVEFQLRYRLGRYCPKFGPLTLFIAARPKS